MDDSRSRNVYGLYTLNPESGERKYFYVGLTLDVVRRAKQHRWATDKGREDKYAFMRQLIASGTKWHTEVLRVMAPGEYPPDGERWFVIDLTRKGHRLMNMRHGNRERLKEIAEQVASPSIRRFEDVTLDRQTKGLVASKRLARKVLHSTLRHKGILDLEAARVLPPVLYRRITATPWLPAMFPGTTLKEVVLWARIAKRRARFYAEVLRPMMEDASKIRAARALTASTLIEGAESSCS
jgi:hypothetical protein